MRCFDAIVAVVVGLGLKSVGSLPRWSSSKCWRFSGELDLSDALWLIAEVREGLHYADSHEWVKVEGDIGIVGITDHAQVCMQLLHRHLSGAGLQIDSSSTGCNPSEVSEQTPWWTWISILVQSALGDLVFVELPENGASVTSKEKFGSVESVKAVSDIISPISGEVVETNTTLGDAPETVTLQISPYSLKLFTTLQ